MSHHAGFSLVAKAPWGALITALVLAAMLFFTPVHGEVILLSLTGGAVGAALLLAYWLGKGGMYFILAQLAPLALIVVAPLPDFIALAQLVNAYFLGASVLLTGYRVVRSRTHSSSER